MCDFPSWIETNDGTAVFLTDKDIDSCDGMAVDYDCIGHHAIRKIYPKIKGDDREGFPCHPDVAKEIIAGKMRQMMKIGGYAEIYVNAHGKIYRDNDQPAAVYADGTKRWYKNGKIYRDNDQPAEVYADGTKFWYKNGKIHRDNDQPAAVYADGTKFWYKNGKIIPRPKI